jgi:hypothetical protein
MSECSWFFWTCDRNSGCSCLMVCPFWVDNYICLPTLTWGQWVVMAACHCQLFMIRWHGLRLCEATHMRLWLHSLSCYLQKNLLSRFLCNRCIWVACAAISWGFNRCLVCYLQVIVVEVSLQYHRYIWVALCSDFTRFNRCWVLI